ncbi:hypothetical protein Cob_v002501 [Colletotrichum orbiculare MAFF 240422]|uniref:Uncharacterized protein n=1 Tax=Colletotrichum orbiculare (strain 104-T / ATCC 96160 / CBS 514.97 / LARS 414 / MAFF 240422) TaxID=1213857 RepID=A0A484G3W5_COLOR|nr:hypothetical protein Cob_v002501 [Colletotrichum orbiculare MAFF 240422]
MTSKESTAHESLGRLDHVAIGRPTGFRGFAPPPRRPAPRLAVTWRHLGLSQSRFVVFRRRAAQTLPTHLFAGMKRRTTRTFYSLGKLKM